MKISTKVNKKYCERIDYKVFLVFGIFFICTIGGPTYIKTIIKLIPRSSQHIGRLVTEHVIFLDEATFHIIRSVNRNYCRIWGSESPQENNEHYCCSSRIRDRLYPICFQKSGKSLIIVWMHEGPPMVQV